MNHRSTNEKYKIFKNIREGNVEGTKSLIASYGGTILKQRNDFGNQKGDNPLHTVVRISNKDKQNAILQILIPIIKDAPDEINTRSGNGKTPLELAIDMNSTNLIVPFLQNGANLKAALDYTSSKICDAECLEILEKYQKQKTTPKETSKNSATNVTLTAEKHRKSSKFEATKKTFKNPMMAASAALAVTTLAAALIIINVNKQKLPAIIISSFAAAFLIASVVIFVVLFKKNSRSLATESGNNEAVQSTIDSNKDSSESHETSSTTKGKSTTLPQPQQYKHPSNKNIPNIETNTAKQLFNDLCNASGSGNVKQLTELLKNSYTKQIINDVNDEGNTPLHIAIMNNQKEALIALIGAEANFNKVEGAKYSALEHAINTNNVSIFDLLIKNGADILETTHEDGILHYAIDSGIDSDCMKIITQLFTVIKDCHAICLYFLKNLDGNELTPLIKFCKYVECNGTTDSEKIYLVNSLIEAVCKAKNKDILYKCDNDGNNFLHYLVINYPDRWYEFLDNIDLRALNVQNKRDYTPLGHAVWYIKSNIVKKLLPNIKPPPEDCSDLFNIIKETYVSNIEKEYIQKLEKKRLIHDVCDMLDVITKYLQTNLINQEKGQLINDILEYKEMLLDTLQQLGKQEQAEESIKEEPDSEEGKHHKNETPRNKINSTNAGSIGDLSQQKTH